LLQGIRDYANRLEFSDITFIVEGKKFFAHKLILSLLSERFKAMFSIGMAESKQKEIEIHNISYPVFSSIMQYLYTGDFHFGADLEGQEHSLEYLFEFLRVSDEYILEDVIFYFIIYFIGENALRAMSDKFLDSRQLLCDK
jgi:leucine-zipper-like transcriptional regulator 1